MVESATRNINDLPRELLEEIFYHHVCVNFRSRHPLLRTCKTWYNITTSYARLWQNIALGFLGNRPSTRMAVVCSTVDSLAIILNRIGTTSFTLHIGEGLWNYQTGEQIDTLIPQDWLSRCRSLTISSISHWGSTVDVLVALLRNCRFDALNVLELLELKFEDITARVEALYRNILRLIDDSATNLRILRIRYLNEWSRSDNSHWITDTINGCSSLLPRITGLHLAGVHGQVHWASFSNLDQLGYLKGKEFPSFAGLEVVPLRRLTLKGNLLPSMPAAVWDRLTHLSLLGFSEHVELLNLSSLTSMLLLDCHFDVGSIHVPKLEALTIRLNTTNGLTDTYPPVQKAKFSPRIVHIDVQEFEEEYDREWGDTSIQKDLAIFTMPIPFWNRVEELHLWMRDDYPSDCLPDPIQEALAGTPSEQIYPALRCLTLLKFDPFVQEIEESTPSDTISERDESTSAESPGPFPELLHSTHQPKSVSQSTSPGGSPEGGEDHTWSGMNSQREELVGGLRGIMEARIKHGMKRFERLEVGLERRFRSYGYGHSRPNSEVTWIDCLRQRERHRSTQ